MSEQGLALRGAELTKNYRQGGQEIVVLRGTNIAVQAGEKVAIVGRSGSGKSTLLHILAGLDTPDVGQVWIDGTDMVQADNNARAALRAQAMGFVYQNHHLLPEFSALENIALPLRIAGFDVTQSREQAMSMLDQVGLADRSDHLPGQLSGGERQRVAVARATVGQRHIVLADEPTGNLDNANAEQVMDLISRLADAGHTAFLIVTHDETMLRHFDRVLRLSDGVLLDV